MPVAFEVYGDLPPKKDGAKSMWNKDIEVPRLIKLRAAAITALGDRSPFVRNISLRLEVHVGPVNSRATGDLDNFVTGTCDGLMAAHPRALISSIWHLKAPNSVQPDQCIAIKDDCEIVRIEAEKVIGDSQEPWYRVEISGD